MPAGARAPVEDQPVRNPESFHFSVNLLEELVGGGAVNSRIAAESIGVSLGESGEIRYLDANNRDGLLDSEVAPPIRYLGLRECSRNFVVGSREDKWIFRSKIGLSAALGPLQLADIAWLCKAQTVLVNSPKDLEPVKAIVNERARRGFELIFVLTPSLPADFVRRVVLPAVDVVIGSWDELQFLTGDSPVTVEGAALTAERLQCMAQAASQTRWRRMKSARL